jgi:23S rRNA pseudoU1915 N3-methylase RlmH
MRHLTYLRTHKPSAYREFLRNGKLNSYLAQINASAQAMFDRLVIQLAKSQGITEALKAQDQMEWVRSMNAIRHTAEEIILSEVIYA